MAAAQESSDLPLPGSATLTFHDFLEKMRHPSAADLVRSIKSFILSFLSAESNPEVDSASVQGFLGQTEATFRAHKLWAGASEEELESAGEGLEKYLMTKLFTKAFNASSEDAEKDRLLSERMAALQHFLQPEHLDIPPTFRSESSWLLAQKELQKMNQYKAPRDKLVCLLNCCRVINNLLLNMSMAANGAPPGADDFLPVLIYVVIKANPPQLYSNLMYIQRYRLQSRLVSEAAYFYTNLVSAAAFIENLTAASLSMDPAEFEKRMQLAVQKEQTQDTNSPGERVNSKPTQKTSSHQAEDNLHRAMTPPPGKPPLSDTDGIGSKPGTHQRSLSDGDHSQTRAENALLNPDQPAMQLHGSSAKGLPALSTSDLEAAGAEAVVIAAQGGELGRDYKFLHASVGDLRVGDVEALLAEYKELVLKYEALARSLQERRSRVQSPPPKEGQSEALLRSENGGESFSPRPPLPEKQEGSGAGSLQGVRATWRGTETSTESHEHLPERTPLEGAIGNLDSGSNAEATGTHIEPTPVPEDSLQQEAGQVSEGAPSTVVEGSPQHISGSNLVDMAQTKLNQNPYPDELL